MQTMDPVNLLVQIKRIPPQLVGNVMQLVRLGGHARVIRIFLFRAKFLVSGRGNYPVDPALLVLVARGREGRPGELLSVEAIGGFLGGVLRYWQGTFNSFCSAYGQYRTITSGSATYSWYESKPFWYL